MDVYKFMRGIDRIYNWTIFLVTEVSETRRYAFRTKGGGLEKIQGNSGETRPIYLRMVEAKM